MNTPYVHRRTIIKSLKYFVIATMAVAVPTGIKVFSWLCEEVKYLKISYDLSARIYNVVRCRWDNRHTVSKCKLSRMLHDTYYVVAHFHYVLSMQLCSLLCQHDIIGLLKFSEEHIMKNCVFYSYYYIYSN